MYIVFETFFTDSTSLRVYLNTGEDFLSSLEFSVSNVWSTRFGILLDKNASSTTIESHAISLPRLFSLSHPLDEMSPVLIKSNIGTVGYLTESDYKVIFANVKNDLVMLYDNKVGKHFVSKLRKATAEETNTVSKLKMFSSILWYSYYNNFSVGSNDSVASGINASSQHVLDSQSNSLKFTGN